MFIAHGLVDDIVIGKYNLDGTVVDPSLIFDPFGEGEFAVFEAALYLAQLNTLAKYTTSGKLVTYPLISPLGPSGFQISGVAVDDSATVPETPSTLWVRPDDRRAAGICAAFAKLAGTGSSIALGTFRSA